STPSLNCPSASGQLASAADQVSESTGTATAAWTPAGSNVPFPTTVSMSPSVLLLAPPTVMLHGWPAGLQTPSLVSPTLLTSASAVVELASQRTPLPNPPPDSQPSGVTCEVKLRAGMQKIGTEKPFAGMITLCLQVASPASMSSVVTTPGGKGNAVSTPTTSVPAAVCVEMRPAGQHWVPSVVVVVDPAVVL